jgi:hypothetical protein
MVTWNEASRADPPRVLAEAALIDLEATLSAYGSSWSPQARTALSALLKTLEAGLTGELPPSYYLSSIDPGTGKTLAVSKFLKAWKASCQPPASSCASRGLARSRRTSGKPALSERTWQSSQATPQPMH